MKIGFSSQVCPGWDLETILTKAAELGFDGVELRGLRGELNLPLVPELARDPQATLRRFEERGVELVCLAACVALDSKSKRKVDGNKATIVEYIELASQLSCPYVRILMGEVQRFDNQRAALARIAEAVRSLIPVASRHDVVLLVENGGDFPGSDGLWFVTDAADHPAVRVCWNQSHAMAIRERCSTSVPRLGSRISLVHACDAAFDERGLLVEYKLPGDGETEVAKQIELLKGLAYDGYVVFDWPKLWVESLPDAETVLPGVARFLRECIDAKQAVLTAYKSDKNKPRMSVRKASEKAM